MIGAVQFAVDEVFAPERLSLLAGPPLAGGPAEVARPGALAATADAGAAPTGGCRWISTRCGAGFCEPPDEARPRAWWHWMDGNVDPEGIRLDLEWLHRVGVRGVQMFDGGMGTPLVVPERVRHGSPEWRAAVRLAAVDRAPARARVHGRHVRRLERGRRALGRARRRDEEGRLVGDRRRRRPPGRAAARAAAGRRRARTRTARGGAPIPAAHRFAQDWITVAVPADQAPSRARPGGRPRVGSDRRLVVPGRRQLRRRRLARRGTPTARRRPGSSRSSTSRSTSLR